MKAEVGPRKVLDLELIASRESIERSLNLHQALKGKKLRLLKYSVVKTHQKAIPTPVDTRPAIDENRLREMIQQTIVSEMQKNQPETTSDTEAVRHIFTSGMKELQNSIREQLNNIQIAGPAGAAKEEMDIDPVKLAELQQKAVEKMTGDIQTGGSQEGKKIKIVNANVKDLASEL